MAQTPAYSLDQQRIAINLADAYAVWMEAKRYNNGDRWRWKRINEKDYLYRLDHGSNNGVSLGPRSEATERIFTEHAGAEARERNGAKRLLVLGRMYKAARMPLIAPFAGNALRALDAAGLLGRAVQVVGTQAIGAYELEAGLGIDKELCATEDFDLSLLRDDTDKQRPSILEVLRKSDASWTASMEKSFQAINGHGERIDLLVAQGVVGPAGHGGLQAIEVPGQEDLMVGDPVTQVLADFGGRPARMVAPDPRAFMLHKFLLAQEDNRHPMKRHKDAMQALAVLDMVRTGMPHRPMDAAFVRKLPARLRAAWSGLQAQTSPQKRGRRPV